MDDVAVIGRSDAAASLADMRGARSDLAVFKLAVLAVGGQGGGVLTDWIVATAERCGWFVQSTSVPGVAQRTGATIYYLEMLPRDPARADREPVLALMPAPGDVDMVVAAELMEAGRAVQRGLVTRDRTLVVTSTHRSYAVGEKIVPGNGVGDSDAVLRALAANARQVIAGDMERAASSAGSVISASLLGAVAASGALPFAREAWEAAIRDGERGVEASLKAFAAGWALVAAPAAGPADPPQATARAPARAGGPAPDPARAGEGAPATAPLPEPVGPEPLVTAWRTQLARLQTLPPAARAMAGRGLVKVVDYLDPDYGAEYLDRVLHFATLDRTQDQALTTAAAKWIANALCYDDVARVAELKIRDSRMTRITREAGAKGDQVLRVTEYFHPRMAELLGLMPARLGAWLERRQALVRWLDRRLVDRGRRVRSSHALWVLLLSWLAARGRTRRTMLRHRREMAHMEAWLAVAERVSARDPALAVQVLHARRLIKGYSDTHARGLSKFDRVMSAVPKLEGRGDAAEWLDRLIRLALKDVEGRELDGALRTIAGLGS